MNSLSLTVCLLGGKLFGRTAALILAIVSASGIITIGSFFQCLVFTEYFSTISEDQPYCQGENLPQNCTVTVNGSFYGICTKKTLWGDNLIMDFQQDCSDAKMPVSFSVVFGVLFSSVTGIMAGANLSGELNNPGKAISRGTLSAMLVTFVFYLVMVTGTAMTCERSLLFHDCYYLNKISIFPPSITIGSFLLTFSASLSNLIGVSINQT